MWTPYSFLALLFLFFVFVFFCFHKGLSTWGRVNVQMRTGYIHTLDVTRHMGLAKLVVFALEMYASQDGLPEFFYKWDNCLGLFCTYFQGVSLNILVFIVFQFQLMFS